MKLKKKEKEMKREKNAALSDLIFNFEERNVFFFVFFLFFFLMKKANIENP